MSPFRQNSMFKHTARATAALGLAAVTSIASAAPLSELFFEQLSGFALQDSDNRFPVTDVSIFQPVGPANTVGDSIPGFSTYDQIEWKGTDLVPFSSLGIENFNSDSGDMMPGLRFDPTGMMADLDGEWNEGDIWVIDTITHINNEIFGGQFSGDIWGGDSVADFTVFSDALGGTSLITDPDSVSGLEFTETVNGTSCEGANRPSPFFDGFAPLLPTAPPVPGCDDFFDVALDTSPLVSGIVDGYIYEIGFTVVPGITAIGELNAMNEVVLTEVGNVLICGGPFDCGPLYNPGMDELRIYTPEYGAIVGEDDFGVASINIAAFWTARRVPAPTPLVLIAVGLVGMSLRSARKSAS